MPLIIGSSKSQVEAMPRCIMKTAGASMSLIPLDSSESATSIATQMAPWNPIKLRITSIEIVTAIVAYPNTMIFRQFLLSCVQTIENIEK